DFKVTKEKITDLNFTVKYTEDVTKLGTCESLKLDVYEITHASNHDARVGIAQDAFRLMLYKSYYNRALVIFKPVNSNKYRFSLLQIEAEQAENSSRITRSFSNPRRYSFQLGEGAHVKTPEQFLLEKDRLAKKDGSYFNDLEERFSVEILTKIFYKELSDWYFWALKNVEFPSKPTPEQAEKEDKPLEELIKEHNATNVIRMLTRLLFVWFIKQKGLIPEELFDVNELEDKILTELNPVKQYGLFTEMGKESVYYKAILQNLFFASLNCPVKPQSGDEDKRYRRFRKNEKYGEDRANDWLFRYETYFKNPDTFVELINSKVPFLNGGLFECLDDKYNDIIIDGFSDNLKKPHRLTVPDYLFFGRDESVDLSEDYGDDSPKYKQASVKGLINILKTYNFTVEENTPAEVVVALDPELLGKVFENLLASFNPETKTTARKQTGSFYTPREIVNYMVDESLIAYFNGKTDIDEENLRDLFQYTDEEHKLNSNQVEELVNALYECKILDPACGSGAFPMGVLQQLVHILKKVDPENIHWKKIQQENASNEIQKVLDIEDKDDRETRLIEINNAFDITKNRPDYARKLYLIENCIYGVDIRPIAIQISKLRFFISLVVDQKNKFEDDNFGIIPLPNLETKFVTANTLIGINRPSRQLSISDTVEIRKLKEELRLCRHKIFSAKTKKTKQKYRKIDKEKRQAIAEELKNNGWNNDDADKLANWDPYDQNASSPFFDPEWMFGLERENGNLDLTLGSGYFDIVISNPPYKEISDKEEKILFQNNYNEVLSGHYDLYIFFFKKGIDLLVKDGILAYITPHTFIIYSQFINLRKWLLKNTSIIEITDRIESIFDSAVVDNSITLLSKNNQYNKSKFTTFKYNNNKLHLVDFEILSHHDDFSYDTLDITTIKNKSKIKLFESDSFPLGEVVDSTQGITVYAKVQGEKINYFNDRVISKFSKPVTRGRYIFKYKHIWNGSYMEYGNWLWCKRQDKFFEEPKIFLRQTSSDLIATYIEEPFYCIDSVHSLIKKDDRFDIKYILAILNSKLGNYIYHLLIAEKGKVFAQVKLTFLRRIPIKLATVYEQNKIIKLVNEIYDTSNNEVKMSGLINKLDVLIFKLYNLNYEEVKIIDPDIDFTEEEYTSQ
ncbi:MAG: TaqI-like C-terminal specificity domain-containing protein, partial [Dysgonamonadaceae bacterium]|nr:TaqI-like C-terminal specificity domain-containing protein [Dysgonamonadaceae bacterium]